MPTNHTAHFKERTRASAGEEPVVLLEIDHPELLAPQRVVNDTDDLVSNGDTYVACGFQTALPDDVATLSSPEDCKVSGHQSPACPHTT